MEQESQTYVARYIRNLRRTPRGKRMFRFSSELYKARIQGDAELENALREARSRVRYASEVDVLAIKRKLQRGVFKPRRKHIDERVVLKVRAARQLEVPLSTLLTPEEAKWRKRIIRLQRRYYRLHRRKKIAEAAEWKRNHRKRWNAAKKFDNAIRTARKSGHPRLVAMLKAEHFRVGRTHLVNVDRIRNEFYASIGGRGRRLNGSN